MAAILGGMLLILISMLPWENYAQQTLWTEQDSKAFAKISAEYHRMSYQSPERAGLSEEQLSAQIDKAKGQFEAFQAKLQSAQQMPLTWKRYLLWAGVLLTTCGCLGHFASDRK